MKFSKNVNAKSSWLSKETHYLNVIADPWYKAILQIQNTITEATVPFYHNRGISTMYLPITTGSISSPMGLGSDSSPVQIEIDGKDTYLADSMQFMLEYGCRMTHGVYYIMPSFRGEHADERHLCQFFHSEVEIPGMLDDIIELAEAYVAHLAKSIITTNENVISPLLNDLSHFNSIRTPFPRIRFSDAVELLIQNGLKEKAVTDHNGFQCINHIGEEFLIKYFGGFVWLTHFQHNSVPFYQAYDSDPKYALNADLLFGIGEVIGSGQRHCTKEQVELALNSHGVDKNDYKWYCDMKEKFPIQTSGFGMGIERFLLWCFQHNDIRDMQILPRFNGEDIYV